MPQLSKDQSDERRARIVDAIRTLFISEGFMHMSISDIVRASGQSTGAVYSYFDGKEELIVAVCESALEDVSGAIARHGTARAAVEWMFDVVSRTGRMTGEIFSEAVYQPRLAEAVAESHRRFSDELTALIEADRARDGAAARLDARSVADLVISALGGYRERRLVGVAIDRDGFLAGLFALLGMAGA